MSIIKIAAMAAPYVIPVVVKEAVSSAKPKIKGFFTRTEHHHEDGKVTVQETHGKVRKGEIKEVKHKLKPAKTTAEVKKVKTEYKLKE